MRKYFATGLVAIIPAALVLWLATVVYDFLDALVGDVGWWAIAVGLVVSLLGISVVGALLIHSKIIRQTREWLEGQIVARTPLVKTVYAFAQQFTSQVIEEKRYDKVVRVYPFGKSNASLIGFLTDEVTSTVFVPSSPNPLSGQTYIGAKYDLLPDWTYDDVLKYDMSVGVVQKKV